MAKQERFLFETAGEANAFLAGLHYVRLPELSGRVEPEKPTEVTVVLLDEDELPTNEEVYQDLAAYVDHFAASGFKLSEVPVGEMIFLRWELNVADGRFVVLSMNDGIRIPGYDDPAEVRIYTDAGQDETTKELRRYPNPRAALVALCSEFDLPMPNADQLDQEYEHPG